MGEQLDMYVDETEPPTVRAPGTTPPKQRRGFALLTPEQVRAIASKGGRAAHARGVAHQWTSEEARTNGRKGGLARGRSKAA